MVYKKIITHNTIGLCIASELQDLSLCKEATVGYLSIGKEFDESNSFWAKLNTKHRCVL